MPWWSSGRGLLPTPLPGRLLSWRLSSGRLFSALTAALVGGWFLTEEEFPDAGVLRTEELPLFPSRDVTLLTDEEAGRRVVVWRPMEVVLSAVGVVCRVDEDERCLVEVAPARLS